MKTIQIQANAKINLTLDVLSKREDGYHEIETLMQSVSLCDYVTLKKQSNRVTISVNVENIASDEDNIAVKAARLFFAHTGMTEKGVHIHLIKHIPIEAGLAGGSADAAAVLIGLDKLYNTEISLDELCSLGVRLGADVPFCILGGCVHSSGIGEVMMPVDTIFSCALVIAKPAVGISTAQAFYEIDHCPPVRRPIHKAMLTALKSGDIRAVSRQLCNVFEESAIKNHPEISVLKNYLLEHGACGTQMSGSGSAVFGLFHSEEGAKKAADKLKSLLDDTQFFVCRTTAHGLSLEQ